MSKPTAYDTREATIESIRTDIVNGVVTCRSVVTSFISRILALDDPLGAVICLNPKALETADALDATLSTGGIRGPLFGIPVLLKDNYDEVNMSTTGGSLALANLRPGVDAATVTALKNAGAIILGKVNMHEMALEGLTVSSLSGQTVNPFDFSRTPGGSSGGSAVAVAASFCVFSTGGDTMNSLRSPASANSLFSIRPTWGLVSRSGIIPISYTQDVAGPIARCTQDLATALTVMAKSKPDPKDPHPPADFLLIDYQANLKSGTLQGLRLGFVETFLSKTAEEAAPVNNVMASMLAQLRRLGSIIVPITQSIYDSKEILATTDTQQYEFREELDAYLQRPTHTGTFPTSFEALFRTEDTLVIPTRRELIRTALVSSTKDEQYRTIKCNIERLKDKLEKTFTSLNLDALIYPEQANLVVKIGAPSQHGRNGILAAVTGWPVVVVPAGFSDATESAPVGVPVGMEILGRPWTEEKLLQLAYQIETRIPVRRVPRFVDVFVAAEDLAEVPGLQRSVEVHAAYPVGKCLR